MQSNLINRLTSSGADYAFNPESCVFVSANAGSGKTGLLTNRVLSLLLHGVEPSKILCLTFTKAAASEMESRVLASLGSWVMAGDDEVRVKIGKFVGDNPSEAVLSRARSLFASVLESPSGVNIRTIHGFSQSLLKKFPLEAGISPYFTVMDSRSAQEVMTEAKLRLFSQAQNSDSTIRQALDNLAVATGESEFSKLLYEIVVNKGKFGQLFKSGGGTESVEDELRAIFDVASDDTPELLIEKYFTYSDDSLSRLKEAARILFASESVTDLQTAARIADWSERPQARGELIDGYIANFLTLKGEKRARIFTRPALKDEKLIEELQNEQQRVYEFAGKLAASRIVRHSIDVLRVAESLLAGYEAIKRHHGVSDYDDLIISARDLLAHSDMAPWVLFKLDGGIDHILVDEAQDTGPEQWQIVTALVQEFFAGQGAKEEARSLFIVGDEKQSIYSFQGADVKEFIKMKDYFSDAVKAAQKQLHLLSLSASYRSTGAVLSAVDKVFASAEARAGVVSGDEELRHILTRTESEGSVEIMPLFVPSSGEDDDEENIAPQIRMVRHIADRIYAMIANGQAKAGEIMILLRSRTSLADRLVRALKRRGVPVAGSDRMSLNADIAVQDLLALGQVLLFPDDDFTLACCLKSPIFNLSEDDLFTLAAKRGNKTLWQRLGSLPQFAEAYQLLVDLRAKADFMPPFELYSYLLYEKKARARFVGRTGTEIIDPIEEFMQQTLLYERIHPPSLQGFLHFISVSHGEIKRDPEQARDEVRIMTVHGSKGLQSKVVILPDTTEVPRDTGSLLWLNSLPVRLPSSDVKEAIVGRLKAENQADIDAEYRRLLYVALTRAEDRLYIYGATGKKKISEKSWYSLIEKSLGETHSISPDNEESVKEKIKIESEEKNVENFDLSFLNSPVPFEPLPGKPLRPSQTKDEFSAASPLDSKRVYSVGKFVHLLLQYLPAHPPEKRKGIAENISYKFAGEIDVRAREKAISEVIKIIENPEFAVLFGVDSRAEVPITGNVEIAGKTVTVSGQIDRLYIGEKEIWIVDFKSNALPPAAISEVSPAYIRQLSLYRLLMQKIMPGKIVRCALLWTANARFDILQDGMLDEVVIRA